MKKSVLFFLLVCIFCANIFSQEGNFVNNSIFNGIVCNDDSVIMKYSDDQDSGTSASNRTSIYLPMTFGISVWDYGSSFLDVYLGLRLGAKIIRDNFSMNIAGDFGGFAGLSTTHLNYQGGIFGYYYGVMAELFLSSKYGFSFGGGMASGSLSSIDLAYEYFEDFSFPYLEIGFLIGDVTGSSDIYTRIYFSDAKWYSSFSIGIRMKFDFFMRK